MSLIQLRDDQPVEHGVSVSLILWKLLFAVLAGAICFLGALLPTRAVALLRGKGPLFISLANCLGAGILLGAALEHLLSDSDLILEKQEPPITTTWAHAIVGIGFLASFATGKVLFGHGHSHSYSVDGSDAGHGHGHGHGDDEEGHVSLLSDGEEEEERDDIEEGDHSNGFFSGSLHRQDVADDQDNDEQDQEQDLELGVNNICVESPDLLLEVGVHKKKHHHQHAGGDGPHHGGGDADNDDGGYEGTSHNHHDHDHKHKHKHNKDKHTQKDQHQHVDGHDHEHGNSLHAKQGGHEDHHGHGHKHDNHEHHLGAHKHPHRFPWILFVILGLESVTSGSALGVQSSFQTALAVFFAIITHIWAESFTLCVAILKSGRQERETLIAMAAYSTITPFGVAFGMVIFAVFTGQTGEVVSMFLEALAAGSFLYVAISEILSEEFGGEPTPLQTKKMLCVVIGFVFMTLLAFFV